MRLDSYNQSVEIGCVVLELLLSKCGMCFFVKETLLVLLCILGALGCLNECFIYISNCSNSISPVQICSKCVAAT